MWALICYGKFPKIGSRKLRSVIQSLELCIPFNCLECTVFKILTSHKPVGCFRLFTVVKCMCEPLTLGPFYRPK